MKTECGYDLDAAASDITAIGFAENEVASKEMIALITLMGDFNYSANGERFDDPSNVSVSLDSALSSEDITVTICHEDDASVQSTYTLHLAKTAPTPVRFVTEPADAITFVISNSTSLSVPKNEDGTYSLIPGESYAYTVTKVGFAGIDENVLFTVKATVNPEFSGTTPVNVDVNRFVNLPVGGTVTDIEVHTTNGSVNASLPEYTLTYTVNGEFYAEQTYAVGAAITVPEYTVPEGYTFSGWVVPETMPAENLTVDAVLSINVYTVTFVDGFDGSVIAEVSVEHGSNVTAPAAPAHDGYVFTGWNGSLVNVTENRTVTAEYSLLGDVDGDGVVTSADALTVLRMSLGIIATPVSSSLDFSICDIDGSGDITSVDALLIIRKAMQSA